MLATALIINADDFGYAAPVNAAIIRAFRERACSSTTIMANMPGFAEAAELAHQHRLVNHIGLHLVLDEGRPLSERIKRYSRFCDDDGRLCFRRAPNRYRFSTAESTALADEMRAQIARCQHARLPLTHVDSHHSVHTNWAVASVLIHVAQENQIPFIRLHRNCGRARGVLKRTYRLCFNRRLERAHLRRTRYFGGIEDYQLLCAQLRVPPSSMEIMVHPVLSEDGRLLDNPGGPELLTQLRCVNGYGDAQSFSGARFKAAG